MPNRDSYDDSSFTHTPQHHTPQQSNQQIKVRFVSSDLAKIDLNRIREPRDLLLYVVFVYCSFVRFPSSLCKALTSLIAASTATEKGSSGGFYLRDKDWMPMVLWDDERKAETVRRQLRRWRKDIKNWQLEHGKVLVTIRSGQSAFQRDNSMRLKPNSEDELIAEAVPTHYTLPIVEMSLELIEENFQAILEEMRSCGDRKLRSPLIKSIIVQLNDRLEIKKEEPVQNLDYDARIKKAGTRARSEIWRMVELANELGLSPRETYRGLLEEIHNGLDGPVDILQKEQDSRKPS